MRPHNKPRYGLVDKFLNLLEDLPGSDRFLVRMAFLAVIFTGIWLIFSLNQQYSATTPTKGGSFTEGIVGTPRFVNPVLASTKTDEDVAALVYSGLMKINPEGELVNDIASSIDISDDGLTYDIKLRKDVYFHDGTPLTAKDVVFTIHLIQNPDLKSPLRGNWNDVTVEQANDYELTITLTEAYSPFKENFRLGILPSHIWDKLSVSQLPFSQLNTEPIGSGPYKLAKVSRDDTGLIKSYTLAANPNSIDKPKIDSVTLSFFKNEDELLNAMKEGKVDNTAYLNKKDIGSILRLNKKLIEEPLPRVFGIFFNQNRSVVLRDKGVREALAAAIDRQKLIKETLYGYGIPIGTPTVFSQPEIESTDDSASNSTSTQKTVSDILTDNGWSLNDKGVWEKEIDGENTELRITIKTRNTPLFDSMLSIITKTWSDNGIIVTTEQFEQADLVQTVIRPRDFEALLFGLDMSRSYDLYPFWHSSQQDDPGLNIAQYANVEVDKLLDSARKEQSTTKRMELLLEASRIIAADKPAIFLFQPAMTYVISDNLKPTTMKRIGRQSDRFDNIADWHAKTESLWGLFRKEQEETVNN